jgi:hypothetical protein
MYTKTSDTSNLQSKDALIPQKNMEIQKATAISESEKYFPEFRIIIIDATEQIIHSKTSKQTQKTITLFWKKRIHTIKNQYTIINENIIHKPPLILLEGSYYHTFKTKHLPSITWRIVDIFGSWIQENRKRSFTILCSITTQKENW